ncbi:hypothetical protein RMN57_13215 [Kitasatospora sp. CM 4170]|uniref:Uncharacterized protein n=1 Tax=Kitasatospora aburaviensis TaxID=67265 RepID=A0ABW1ERT2_9ACTN|nr:hypothetical protein [Kitasatospora sp. CM 4170]WNM45614.1 hypothetical protein RMN57_13215 [Kitasatospora sp. CM 4170]
MRIPFRHPLASHPARTVLGWRRDGRPIYPIAGGNGEGEGAGGTGETGQDGGSQTPPTSQTPTPPAGTGRPASPAAAGAGDDQAATIARLQKELASVRDEAAKARIAKQTAADAATTDLTQKLAKALGLVPDTTPPDPAELTKQIETQTGRIGHLEQQLRARQVELAVHARATALQTKPDALLDSRAFAKAIGDLDPAAGDFTAQLDAAIKAAADSNPNFRSVPQAGRSGADLTGGTGEATKQRPTTLGAAISGHYQT